MKATKIKTILLSAGMIFATASMTTSCNMSRTAKGAVIGTTAGAAAGAGIGKAAGSTTTGAILGAVVGGATGAVIGRRMDKQAEEMEKDLEGVEVERIGEGIKLTFDSGIMFAVNSYSLNAQTKAELDELASIVNKYEDTDILIEGHTDATGSDDYNMTLSKQRANAVKSYLLTHGVDASRLTSAGYGENQPVASNDDEAGRQKNRRVELAIYANEDMVEAAEDGTIGQ